MVKYTEHDDPGELQDWEYSHLPLDDPRTILPPSLTEVEHPTPMEIAASTPGTLAHALFADEYECENCGQTTTAGVSVTKFNGIDDVTLHFCGEPCAQSWYMRHLRSSEGL